MSEVEDKENQENLKRARREYYHKNKDKFKQYYNKTKDRRLEYQKAYASKNKKGIEEYQAKYWLKRKKRLDLLRYELVNPETDMSITIDRNPITVTFD
tara:strand:- start:6 stop:299 length:294 start_codon:yes stop_codon:yes gene_type:complete